MGDEVPERQRRDVGQVGIEDFFTSRAEARHNLSDLNGVPGHHRVRESAEATRLVHDLLQIAGAEFSPVGEEQAAGDQVVA